MVDEKRAYTLIAKLENVEIRKVEKVEKPFKTKDGKENVIRYIDIIADDEDTNRIYLKDKCMDNFENYKRGMVGTFTVRIAIEDDGFKKKTDITVRAFEPNK